MSSYGALPEDGMGDDVLDFDLAQLSMDFDANIFDDPLLSAVLPSGPDIPLPALECPTFTTFSGALEPRVARPGCDKQAKSTKMSTRLDRTREKNRLAQARYRERQKVWFNSKVI